MSASDYTEKALLNSLFQKTSNFGALGSPPPLYVALCTAAPSDSDDGSTIPEASYSGYSRVSTASSDWNAATGTSPTNITNSSKFSFGENTGTSETVTHFALVDASSGGNLILYGALDSSLDVSNGVTPSFDSGSLETTLD